MKTIIYVVIVSALASIAYRLYVAEKSVHLPSGAVTK